MRWGWGPRFLALRLLLLAQLTEPGHGNEGSRAGSCYCDRRFLPDSPPTIKAMERFREHLTDHVLCDGGFVRFQITSPLRSWSVCGGSKDPWVTELKNCFDRRECGHAYSGRVVQQEHSPPPSIQIPKSTEGAPAVTDIPAQTYLPLTLRSTQQTTLPVGTLYWDKKHIQAHETTTSAVGHSLETGPEAGANQKQLEKNMGPTAGIHNGIIIPVLVLLGIILTAVFLYLMCKRRSKQSPWYSQVKWISEALHGDPESPWQGS